MPDPQAALAVVDLDLGYGGAVVVHGANLSVRPGEKVVVIGPNGCGKSTLLKGMGRILTPVAGRVELWGQPLRALRSREIATQLTMLPQSPSAPSGLSVADLVARGRHPQQRWYQQFSATDERIVAEALRVTRCQELSDELLEELSGGQRQRAWIAMALAQDTSIILLDEPTTYLDLAHQVDILELVTALDRTVVMVLHDISLAARYADRVVVMLQGRIVADGPPQQVVTAELIGDVFGLRTKIVPHPESDRPHIIPLGLESLSPSASPR